MEMDLIQLELAIQNLLNNGQSNSDIHDIVDMILKGWVKDGKLSFEYELHEQRKMVEQIKQARLDLGFPFPPPIVVK